MTTQEILSELNRAKVLFQRRAIEAVIRGPASVDTDRMAETPQAAPGEASVARSPNGGDAQ